jgi:uncharacterized protein (DUF952 family)
MSKNQHEFIYKITTKSLWYEAQKTGILQGMPIDINDGYMHFSTKDQLFETLRLHFKGQRDIFLLGVRTKDIAQNLKWEASRGSNLFPHLYATLKTSIIAFAKPIEVDANGQTELEI